MRYLLVAAGLCAACTAETPGEKVDVRWVLDQDMQSEHAEFETATGFRVHLDEASIELTSVYLYAPPTARLSAIAWLEGGLVSVAHAHGGVDNEKGRRVLAEWTKPMDIDVLGGTPVELPETTAEGGVVDAVKLRLKAGLVAHVRGTAERAGNHWSFEADVKLDEAVQRGVELIELEQNIESGSVVHVSVQPKTWLDLCDFSYLGEGSTEPNPDAATQVAAGTQVGRAISIGVRSPDAYRVYIEQEG